MIYPEETQYCIYLCISNCYKWCNKNAFNENRLMHNDKKSCTILINSRFLLVSILYSNLQLLLQYMGMPYSAFDKSFFIMKWNLISNDHKWRNNIADKLLVLLLLSNLNGMLLLFSSAVCIAHFYCTCMYGKVKTHKTLFKQRRTASEYNKSEQNTEKTTSRSIPL